MQLISIDYKQQQKKIFVTYSSLSDEIVTIYGELSLMMIDLVKFSEKYLNLEIPVSTYFKIELEQKYYVDFQIFKSVLQECIDNRQKCFKLKEESISIILKHLQFMEEDMNARIIFISQLPEEIAETNTLSAENLRLINNIKQNEEYVDKLIKFQDPKFQLLYIVLSTLRQQNNNQQIIIIKLGKTKKSIEEYVKKLKKTYYNKIEFTPIFARRMYCPGTTLIDSKPFHNKLIKLIPQTKVFIKAPPNPKGNNYFVEFYQLTQQFVETFEKLLKQFIDENQEFYDSIIQSSEIIDDANGNDRVNRKNTRQFELQNNQKIMDNSDHLLPEINIQNKEPQIDESYLNDSNDLNEQIIDPQCEEQDVQQKDMKITNKGVCIVQSLLSKLDIKSGFLKKLFLFNQSKREKKARQN